MKPKLGVVCHYKDEEALWDAVRKEYNGPFVVARDLMLINIGETITWEREPAADASKDKTVER